MNQPKPDLVKDEAEHSFYTDSTAVLAQQEAETASFSENAYEQPPPDDSVAFNELRSCADLYRMYRANILDIQPAFQRNSVWTPPAQTRFIDSLIKQLPIPSMCFSRDTKTEKWQVIDGQQRMRAIIRFLEMGAKDWQLSNLKDIDKRLAGKKVSTLRDEKSPANVLYRRLENLTLPVTVMRCNYEKKQHIEYMFTIFHRLNTGGTKLNNQEIRNCIFSGRLNDLLKELNELAAWQQINDFNPEGDQRFKYVEIILRFFAFGDNLAQYRGVLSKFLNDYMRKNREPGPKFIEQKRAVFTRTAELIAAKVLPAGDKLGTSVLEALLVGVANHIDRLEPLPQTSLRELFLRLKASETLSSAYLSGGVTQKDKVAARIQAANEVFSVA